MFDRLACYLFVLTSGLMAQQVFEVNGQVVYTNAAGNRTTLGVGFNPLVTSDGRIVFLSGRRFGYGDPFDCGKNEGRNWVVVYSPATGTTAVLFDKALPFDGLEFCIGRSGVRDGREPGYRSIATGIGRLCPGRK